MGRDYTPIFTIIALVSWKQSLQPYMISISDHYSTTLPLSTHPHFSLIRTFNPLGKDYSPAEWTENDHICIFIIIFAKLLQVSFLARLTAINATMQHTTHLHLLPYHTYTSLKVTHQSRPKK